VSTELGLRERKKLQTRQRITDAAHDLFAERGFDQVPVTEIARRAEVSEATVFNYFPTKEDLVYSGMVAFERTLIDAVRDRDPATSALAAFRDFLLRQRGLLATEQPGPVPRLASIARIIAESPALLARERQTFDEYTRELAALLAEESGAGADDLDPWVVANALMGVHRALKDLVHAQAQAGKSGPAVMRAVLAKGKKAFDLLEAGLAGYPKT
jgi:AcrR family transcriptional regulator